MTLFNVFSLLGGLALFLFGMDIMGKALEKQAGGHLQKILSKLTDNPLKGFFLGLCVTAIIQSSSATTVMVVGFVNSGIMELHQAIGIIMGSNVGTTVTSWLLSLSGLQGDSIWIQMLKPTSFSPILAFIGILLYMGKNEKKKGIGTILIGFAILMTGMTTMSNAVEPLQDEAWFTNLFVRFSNPILGVLVGALVTGIIQSSSASVGILQALSATGVITPSSTVNGGGYQPAVLFTEVTSDLYYKNGSLGRLEIPTLDLSVRIYQGTDSKTLAKGIGHFEDTSIWDGNVCLAAHNRGANSYFGQIHTLDIGEKITLTTKLGTRTYKVTDVFKVSETDRSGLADSGENMLTLYTCVRNQRDQRWCVTAAEV